MLSKPESLYDLLVEEARKGGFAVAGALDIDSVDLSEPVKRYDDWLSRGLAGEMQYLVRGRDRRADPRRVFPETAR